jgi:hypothetical protein
MKSKRNFETGDTNFFFGEKKGELKKVKAVWNKISNLRSIQNDQVHTTVVRRVCAPIPFNQAQLVAEINGEKLESTFSSIYNVRIL